MYHHGPCNQAPRGLSLSLCRLGVRGTAEGYSFMTFARRGGGGVSVPDAAALVIFVLGMTVLGSWRLRGLCVLLWVIVRGVVVLGVIVLGVAVLEVALLGLALLGVAVSRVAVRVQGGTTRLFENLASASDQVVWGMLLSPCGSQRDMSAHDLYGRHDRRSTSISLKKPLF